MSPFAPSALLPKRVRDRVRRTLDAPLIVLVYHRVLPHVGCDPHQLAVSTAHFEAHIRWLAAHARPVDELQMIAALDKRRRWSWRDTRPRVLVTFDDGYADNVNHALPILRRYQVPAVVFATTGRIGQRQPFWWDALAQLVPRFDGRVAAHAELHAQLKRLPTMPRDAELERLARFAGIEPRADDDSRPMTWDELRIWRDAGMGIGGHTRTHPCLSQLSDQEIREEITGCRADLRDALGLDARLFAYPYGSRDAFDARCEAAVRDAGFACGLANRDGDARWASSSFAVPRCLIRDWELSKFEARFRRWCA